MATRLPEFLLIGAPRSGTTALHNALLKHPDFFLPKRKETHFFSGGGDPVAPLPQRLGAAYNVVGDAETYARCFAGAEHKRICGEIDPSILVCAPYAVPKIREHLGNETRFIVTLRHPVDRAFSHYILTKQYMHDPDSFETHAAMVTPVTDMQRRVMFRFFETSFYYEPLKRFFDGFGREKFLVQLYDDLQADGKAYMQRILEFVGADTRTIPSLEPDTNASVLPKTFMGRFRVTHHPLRRFLREYVPSPLRHVGRRALPLNPDLTREFVKPALSPKTRSMLIPRYREDILRTQDLIQRDLSHWLT